MKPIACRPGGFAFSLSGAALRQAVALGLIDANGQPCRPFQASQPASPSVTPRPAALAPAARPAPADESVGTALARLAADVYGRPTAGFAPASRGQPASFAEIAAQAYRPAKRFTSGLSLGRMAAHLNR